MTRKSYSIVNIIFIAIIAGIFAYCYFLSSLGSPIICIHKEYLGINCPSCGLTRSLAAILHFDLAAAFDYNKYGLKVFAFFLMQLVLRAGFTVRTLFPYKNLGLIIKADGIISSLLFLFCFSPFIFSTFYLFYKMLITGNLSM